MVCILVPSFKGCGTRCLRLHQSSMPLNIKIEIEIQIESQDFFHNQHLPPNFLQLQALISSQAIARSPSRLQSLLATSEDDELPPPFFSFSPFPPLYEGMSLPGGFILPTYNSSSGLPPHDIRCTSVEDDVAVLSGNYYYGASQVVDDLNRRLYLTPNSHGAQDPLIQQFLISIEKGFHTGIFARAERLGLQNVELCPYLISGDADDFRKFASEIEYIKTLVVVELQHQLTPSHKSGAAQFDALATAFFAGEEIPDDLSELPSPSVASHHNFIKRYGTGDWASVLNSDPLEDKSLIGFLRDVMTSNYLEDWVEDGALPLFPQLALERHVIYENIVTFLDEKERVIPVVKNPQSAADIMDRQDERRSKWYEKYQGDNLQDYLVSVAVQMSSHKKAKAAAIVDDPDATESDGEIGEASGTNSLLKDTTSKVLGSSSSELLLTGMGEASCELLPPLLAVGKKAKKNKKSKEKKKAKKLAESAMALSSRVGPAGTANITSVEQIPDQKLVGGQTTQTVAHIATEEITTVSCDTLAANSPIKVVAVKSDNGSVRSPTEEITSVKSMQITSHTTIPPRPLPTHSVEMPLNSTTADLTLVEAASSFDAIGSSASAEPWTTVSYKAAQKAEKSNPSTKAFTQGSSSSSQTRVAAMPRTSDRRKGQVASKPKSTPPKDASQFASVRVNEATSVAKFRPVRLNDPEEFPAMPASSSSKARSNSLGAEPEATAVRLVSKTAASVEKTSDLNNERRGEDESTASDSSSSHDSDVTVVPSKRPETQPRSLITSNPVPSHTHSDARDSHATRSPARKRLSAFVSGPSPLGRSAGACTEASGVIMGETSLGPRTIKELKDFDNLGWADLESPTKWRSRGTRSVMGDLNSEKRLSSTSEPPPIDDDPFASDEEHRKSRDNNRLDRTASPTFRPSIFKSEQTYDGELRVNEQGRSVMFYRKDAEISEQSSPTPRHKRSVSGSGSSAQNSSHQAYFGQSPIDRADTQQVDSGNAMDSHPATPVYPIQPIEGYVEQSDTRYSRGQQAPYHPNAQARSTFSHVRPKLAYQSAQYYQHNQGPHFGMTPVNAGYQADYGTVCGSGGDTRYQGGAALPPIPVQSTSDRFPDRDPTFSCQFCKRSHFPTTMKFPVDNGVKMAVTRSINVLLLADHLELKRFLFRFLRFHLLDVTFFATCNATQPQHVVMAEFVDQFTKEFGPLAPSPTALNVKRSIQSVRQALDLMDDQSLLLSYWSRRVTETPRVFA
ncbi:hypothetical protein QTJ16_003551 [Diplocarpon rosae]|uniref:Uncharacterized protein n=1 Tax=Diplocarpon rosae TaxID=946125 RepID=A0AAD9WDQ8_9HELO|nr:hypothetical protein QTJ16_003551 [Diplocarpon rosae]